MEEEEGLRGSQEFSGGRDKFDFINEAVRIHEPSSTAGNDLKFSWETQQAEDTGYVSSGHEAMTLVNKLAHSAL